MWIKIKPLDTLFFRDGRPFTAGEDTWANTVFPPNPSVIAGALYSVHLANNEDERHAILNGNTPPDLAQSIKQIFLIKDDGIPRILVPAPLDIFKTRDRYVGSDYLYIKEGSCSLTAPILITPDTTVKAEPLTGCFVELESLYKSYYYEAYDNLIVYQPEDMFKNDKKIGVTRSQSTHSSEEGKLYRFNSIQLEDDMSLLVDVDICSLTNGILKLGGEAKAARYEEDKKCSETIKSLSEYYQKKINHQKRFRLLYTAPAVLENPLNPLLNDNLITCCVGKPVSLGGFDRQNNRPKPMQKAIPAGSVYTYDGIVEDNFTIPLNCLVMP